MAWREVWEGECSGACSLEADAEKEKSRRSRDRRTIYLRIFTPHKGAPFAAYLSYTPQIRASFGAPFECGGFTGLRIFSLMRGGEVAWREVWEENAWSVLLRVCCEEYFRRLWVLRSVLRADCAR